MMMGGIPGVADVWLAPITCHERVVFGWTFITIPWATRPLLPTRLRGMMALPDGQPARCQAA